LPEIEQPFGQSRAVEALRLALDIPGRGYNLFVLGPTSSSRHAVVQRLLAQHAARQPAPPDWCCARRAAAHAGAARGVARAALDQALRERRRPCVEELDLRMN
jgi:hypothetical protein